MSSIFRHFAHVNTTMEGCSAPAVCAPPAASAAASASAAPAVVDHRSHLLQVENEVRRAFDGLGSPVSNEADRAVAAQLRASLMFGEILFAGVSRILDEQHLNAGAAGTRTLYDLGSGCGRLCVQAFLEYPNLERVVGVELTSVRSKVGFAALLRMSKRPPAGYESRTQLLVTERPLPKYTLMVAPPHSRSSGVTRALASASRVLELRSGNLFDAHDAWAADILICETNIAPEMQYEFLVFLSHCKAGCRLLTYNSLEMMYDDVCDRLSISTIARAGQSSSASTSASEGEAKTSDTFSSEKPKPPFPWKRLPINTTDDRFSASWGNIHFHLYTCIAPPVHPRARRSSSSASAASSLGASPASRTLGPEESCARSRSASNSFSSGYADEDDDVYEQ